MKTENVKWGRWGVSYSIKSVVRVVLVEKVVLEKDVNEVCELPRYYTKRVYSRLREKIGQRIRRHMMLVCAITDDTHHLDHLVKVVSGNLQFYHYKVAILPF